MLPPSACCWYQFVQHLLWSCFCQDLWTTPVRWVTICEHQDRKPPVIMGANVVFAIEKCATKHIFVNCLSWALLWGMSLTWVLWAGITTFCWLCNFRKCFLFLLFYTPFICTQSRHSWFTVVLSNIREKTHFAASWNGRLLCIGCNGHAVLPAKWTCQVIRPVTSDWRENSRNHERNLMVSIPPPKYRVGGLSVKCLKFLFS